MDETKDVEKFLATARQRAKRAYDAWQTNFERMDRDIKFLDGDHWPDDVINERKEKRRPCLTFNKLPSIVDQIVGDQRQMRPAISVFPAQGDVEGANLKMVNYVGKKDYTLAEVYAGIIRNIEYSSNADMAYDTAAEQCSSWGLGYFRILTDYADDTSFDQDFQIKRIRNYKSVLLDPDFQEPDGSDVEWGFIFTKLHRDEFEKKYPENQAVSLSDIKEDQFEIWVDGQDYIYIAEYYYLKDHTYTLHQMSDGSVLDDEKVAPVLDELKAQGIDIVKTRQIPGKKCCWAKISGKDILESEQDTVFRWVPIIPVLGKELVVNGTPIYRGAIRHSLDAQRMYNYSRTADIERTALIPKVPYIIADKQIDGYDNDWENANTSNAAVLKYKHINGLPPPFRQPPVSTNPGETNQSMLAADDIKSTSNMFDASMGNSSGATSGKQELVLQSKGDRGAFPFSDNTVRSIRHAGRILINAIPKVYDTNRLIRLRFPDDSEDFVEINKTIKDEQTEQDVLVNDMSVGKFDLVVKAGQSYATQRMEAADAITQFVQAIGGGDPVTSKALSMLAVKNMDWPEADKVVDIIRKSLPPGLVDPDPDEPPPQPPQPTPEDMARQAEAQAKIAKAQADMETAKAKQADAEAKMMEIAERLQNLEENMKDTVASLIAESISGLMQQ